MYAVLHNTDNNALTMINANHPDYRVYSDNKDEIYTGKGKECREVVEQFFEDNNIPEELRIFQVVKLND